MVLLGVIFLFLLLAGVACALVGNSYLWGKPTETRLRRKMKWDLLGSYLSTLIYVPLGIMVAYLFYLGRLQAFYALHPRFLVAQTALFLFLGFLWLVLKRWPSMIDTCGTGTPVNLKAFGVFLWAIAGVVLLLFPNSLLPLGVACFILGLILGIVHSFEMVRAIRQRNRSVEAGTMTMLQLLERARRVR